MTTRIYETDEVEVAWDSQRCVHVAECIRALPAVFNPLARPWIRMHAADADAIIEAVGRCPTGALRYRRKDGREEAPETPTSIVPIVNGPLVLRGDLHVVAPDGTTVIRETRLAFCRCGASENKPFCDNAHRRIGFDSGDGVPHHSTARDRAESPDDVGPEQPPSFHVPTE